MPPAKPVTEMGPSPSSTTGKAGDDDDDAAAAAAAAADVAAAIKRAQAAVRKRFLFPDPDELESSDDARKDIAWALQGLKPHPARYVSHGGQRDGPRSPDDFAPALRRPLYDPGPRLAQLRALLEQGKVPAEQRANVAAAIEYIEKRNYETHPHGPIVVFQDGEVRTFPRDGSPWWAEVSIPPLYSFFSPLFYDLLSF